MRVKKGKSKRSDAAIELIEGKFSSQTVSDRETKAFSSVKLKLKNSFIYRKYC